MSSVKTSGNSRRRTKVKRYQWEPARGTHTDNF